VVLGGEVREYVHAGANLGVARSLVNRPARAPAGREHLVEAKPDRRSRATVVVPAIRITRIRSPAPLRLKPSKSKRLQKNPPGRPWLARPLLYLIAMMNTEKPTTLLHTWLKGVSLEMAVRRDESRAMPRPKRNRERERARREARQLFAAYYQECAIAIASPTGGIERLAS
jgi:hypothetical protein